MTGNEHFHTGAGRHTQSAMVSAVIMSDDAALCALISHSLSINHAPQIAVRDISSQQYGMECAAPNGLASQQLSATDLILIDSRFQNGQFLSIAHNIKSINSTCRFILLLDDEEIIRLAPALAEYARQGIDQYILKADISTRQLLSALRIKPAFIQLSQYPNQVGDTAQAAKFTATEYSTEPETEASNNSAHREQTRPDYEYAHTLTIDLENERIHINTVPGSPLCQDTDLLLGLNEWYDTLNDSDTKTIASFIDSAKDYQPVPREISVDIPDDNGNPIAVLLSDIQLKNNGQGRVIGVSAQALVSPTIKLLSSDESLHHGFDNLPDSHDLLSPSNVWQNVTRSLPMLCLLLDEQGAIVRVINEGNIGTQLPQEPTPGIKLADALDIESLDGLGETISRTLNTGKPHHQTIAFPHANGLRWLDTHITKLRGDSGLSRQVVWTAFDITSNRHDYQELLKGHDSIVKILEDAPVLFFQKDSAGRYLRVNKAFCETFNLQADNISGRHDKEVFGDIETRFTDISEQAFANASSQEAFENSYKEELFGTQHQFRWHTLVQKRQSDNQVDFLCGFGVVSAADQSATEQPTADNISTLKPNSSLAMSGALKQDFKTILSSLVNYAELALSQKNQRRATNIADHLSQVESTARHTRELVLEKAGDGQVTANDGLALKPIIEETVNMLRPTLPASVAFETIYQSDMEKALVDDASIKKIVMLLLLNAKSTAESAIVKETDDQTIRLIYDTVSFKDETCAACDTSLTGSYISLTVQTVAASMNEPTLNKLINAAKQSVKTDSDDNVIALTHRVDGHVLIRHANDTLSLQLLFNQA